ncbi:MAG TPA: ATP phosphoribosyltransferase regulatory subunit, partial [Pseudonocardia sp.]|nr:ATP phosphoribosyltransferase regulatory subunit [Pseudonocardia sp.]
MAPRTFAAPKGVPEYTPPDSAGFEHVRDTLLGAADRAGYGLIELPVFEDTALYARGVGESTDVVSKEMYTFLDKGERSVTLRPEGTAGVVRAVIEHGLDRVGLPVKLRYAGPFFRYERPQAGRYRQLQQVGIEAIGVDDPALDAEVIAVADEGYKALGLTGYRLELTSLGDAESRPAYRDRLQEFLAGLPLDEPTRERARINPLRVLDDKRPDVRARLADAPLLVDHLSPAAADAGLRAEPVVHELERRLRVVVQAADHARVLDVVDAEVVEVGEHLRVVLGRGGREVVDQQRRVGEQCA